MNVKRACTAAVLLAVVVAIPAQANQLCSSPQAFMAAARPGMAQPMNTCELGMYGASGPATGNKACISTVQIKSGLSYQQGAPIVLSLRSQNLGNFRFKLWNIDLRPQAEGAQYIGRNLYEGAANEVTTNVPLTQAPGLYYVRVNAVIEHCNGKREILYKDEGPIRVSAAAAAPTPTPAPAPVASGPSCANPQISAALQRAGRGTAADSGTNGLCNPDRYRGQSNIVAGTGAGMGDLVAQSFYCNDPWIGQAFDDLGYGRPQGSGGSGECDINRYGGGRWSGYEDLKSKIRAYKSVAQAPPQLAPVAPVAPVQPAPPPGAPAIAPPAPVATGLVDPGTLPTSGLLQPNDAPAEITSGARELEKFNSLAQNFAGIAASSNIPELQNAAAFLAMSAALGQTISNPREWFAQSGVDDPLIIAAVTEALQQHLNAPEVLQALRRFNSEAVRLAWLINPHAVVADAPWRDRSLTQDGALLYLPPPSLNQRIDHARMGTVQGLLWTMEVNSMLVGNARTVLDFVVNYDNIVSKLMDVVIGNPRFTKWLEGIEKDVGGISGVAEKAAHLEAVKRQLPSIIKFIGDLAAPVAVAMVVAETAKTALDGAAAFLPQRFTDFYVTIAGQRRYPGQPGVPTIAVGPRTPLLVYATYQTAGGEIDTPWGLLEKVAERFLKARKVAALLQKVGDKVNARAADLAKQVGEKLTASGRPLLMQKMRTAAQRASQAHGPRIKAQIDDWVEEKKSTIKYKVLPAKSEVNITGDNVTLIQSRSTHLMDAGTDGKNAHYLTGKVAGQAGYRVAVVGPLLQRINNLPYPMPGGKIMDAVGEVLVQGAPPSGPKPSPAEQKRCGPEHALAYCQGNVCMDVGFGMPWPDHNYQCR